MAFVDWRRRIDPMPLPGIYSDGMNTGSTRRALKNAREVIEYLLDLNGCEDGDWLDMVQTALDDLEVMIKVVE